jgi:hypothetical protein
MIEISLLSGELVFAALWLLCRGILWLRQLAGHTPDEIAAQMSVSRTTAFRALTGAPEIARRLRKGEQMRKVQGKCRTARCPALKRQVSCGIILQ